MAAVSPVIQSVTPARKSSAIRVLIVDDSAVVRQILTRELGKLPGIEVVGAAPDPFVARQMIVDLSPDVLTLDVEMPRMDGITFLQKLMAARPMPVIVVSSLTATGTETALAAMDAGAVDVVGKPGSAYEINGMAAEIGAKVRVAARSRPMPQHRTERPASPTAMARTTDRVLAIGASTGGVQALSEVLAAFPPNAPGTVIVQHMPPKFTASFASRLNQLCGVQVKEAANGDSVVPGRVLIAPGGMHTVLRRSGASYYVEVKDGPQVHHQKPSVDVLFDSVAKSAGSNSVGAILTGMGADGAAGLLKMRQAGAYTVAQDQATSVVYGMPAEAVRMNAATEVLPLGRIAATLMERACCPA
ncbi:protein-glutamate methylesterase/protein-glutamine glutaminase [Humisphaera borealis]|uniref:Protein-glutamate methylesterase/protein-glutamine glutaminase n=1 Tax=Humisphaera borealis TaxID=2807512 RepID=A0A7M2WZV0_9BACT|nr:chemotaxis response regulator protein-glutamate methylesterase [Humisphaera borealis]QOV91037.1 chemotaxis response regulator protein-glutamate methylesterase [Humisphaera borealis]